MGAVLVYLANTTLVVCHIAVVQGCFDLPETRDLNAVHSGSASNLKRVWQEPDTA